MAGFGKELKAAREERGWTLEALSSETKVSARHLEALESDELKALPGGVFRKGIVRAYLAAVGLEELPWMERFHASLAQQIPAGKDAVLAEQMAWAQFANNVRRSRSPVKQPTGVRWLGVFLLFTLLAVATWVLWHSLHETSPYGTAGHFFAGADWLRRLPA
jgi:cytoskeletal protein RodZ